MMIQTFMAFAREEGDMELETLRDLYIDELKDLYSAEKQLVKALPKMVRAASNPELKRAFSDHLDQTQGHVERLETIFADLDITGRGKKCVGMEGVIEEASEIIQDKPKPHVLDAGLISRGQHVEHYEMAGYGTVRTYAEQLGEAKHVRLLEQTLQEEKDADELLSELALSTINLQANTKTVDR